MSGSEISDAAVLTALRRQLSLAAARQAVAAGNLANVDTPGFRAREVDFSAALDRELAQAGRVRVTHANHLPGAAVDSVRAVETQGLPERRDGNNVQIDQELLAMTRAQSDFSRAQTALAAKFRLVRYAINEGR